METDLKERILGLEASITHLERQYDQLNQVVIEQGRLLARLTAAHQQVSSTLETMELERIKSNITKPPHYQ